MHRDRKGNFGIWREAVYGKFLSDSPSSDIEGFIGGQLVMISALTASGVSASSRGEVAFRSQSPAARWTN